MSVLSIYSNTSLRYSSLGMGAHCWTVLLALLLRNAREVGGVLQAADVPPETRLKVDLLREYDKSVRPVYNASKPTNVVADMALQQIIDVDEKQQLLQTSLWMRLYWRDEFLAWDPADYNNITSIKLTPKRAWLPDICIYDALKPAVHANEMQDFFISVDNEGNVMWLSPLVVQSVCHYNVRFFPYDTQFCPMTVGSWMYNGFDVDIWNKSSVAMSLLPKCSKHLYFRGDTAVFENHVEWEVTNFNIDRIVKYYGCCPEPYPILKFTLIMKRKPGFYVTYLYTPSVVIIASSLFAFYLPPGSDSKVDLGVTGLLSQTVFLLLISDLMPPDAYNPPVLGKCLTILLVVQAMAVVVIVIVKRIHDDSIHKETPPSKRLLTVMHYLKFPLMLHHIDYLQPAQASSNVLDHSFGNQGFSITRDDTGGTSRPCKLDCSANRKTKLSNGVANEFHKPTPIDIAGYSSVCPQISELSVEDVEKEDNLVKELGCARSNEITSQSIMDRTMDRILTELREKRKKKMAIERQAEISVQWRHVAAMYDRILFVVFLSVVLGITIWFLTLDPSPESQRI